MGSPSHQVAMEVDQPAVAEIGPFPPPPVLCPQLLANAVLSGSLQPVQPRMTPNSTTMPPTIPPTGGCGAAHSSTARRSRDASAVVARLVGCARRVAPPRAAGGGRRGRQRSRDGGQCASRIGAPRAREEVPRHVLESVGANPCSRADRRDVRLGHAQLAGQGCWPVGRRRWPRATRRRSQSTRASRMCARASRDALARAASRARRARARPRTS